MTELERDRIGRVPLVGGSHEAAAPVARGVYAVVALAVLALPGCGNRDASVTQAPAEFLDAPASLIQDGTGAASANGRTQRGGLGSDTSAGAATAELQPPPGLAEEPAGPGDPDPPAESVAPPADSDPETSNPARHDGEPDPAEPKLGTGSVLDWAPPGNGAVALRDSGDDAPAPKPPEDGLPGLPSAVEDGEGGEEYTYWDGDVERTVRLIPQQPSETGDSGGEKSAAADGQSSSGGALTFLSESGSEMTLTDGVVLLLDPGWSANEVDEFLAANGIARGRASELGWIANGFLIETGPGLESLELANSLASQDGVVISSPNWASDAETR